MLRVYPGADGRFSLYEDDGTTFDFRKGEFQRINVEWNDRARRLSMRLAPGAKMLSRRNFTVELLGGPKKDVSFMGRPVEVSVG